MGIPGAAVLLVPLVLHTMFGTPMLSLRQRWHRLHINSFNTWAIRSIPGGEVIGSGNLGELIERKAPTNLK
jgi:hypothetical protein